MMVISVLFARDAAVVAGVVGDDSLLDRLLERRGQHHVDAPDRTAGQGRAGLRFKPLYPPLALASLYICWIWMAVSRLSLTIPMARSTMWFSMIFL